jgi:hypothetical protein
MNSVRGGNLGIRRRRSAPAKRVTRTGNGILCEALPCPCLRPGDEGGSGGGRNTPTRRSKPKPRAQVIDARIASVVDGDTIKVRAFGAKRRFYTVRLIGIDTRETKKPGVAVECGGKAATSRMLARSFSAPADSDGDGLFDDEGGDGRHIVLRTDPTQDLFDRYDRLIGLRHDHRQHQSPNAHARGRMRDDLRLRQAVSARAPLPRC